MSFIDISFGPMNREFMEAYRNGEVQRGEAWARWKSEDEIFERCMHLYDEFAGQWHEITHCCKHPYDWEHYWLHTQFEVYLASRGEFALIIEEAGYRFRGMNGLTSDTLELPPGELYGISYWHW